MLSLTSINPVAEDAHSSHGAEVTFCNPVAEDAHSSHGAEVTLCDSRNSHGARERTGTYRWQIEGCAWVALLDKRYLSNTASFVLWLFRRVKDRHNSLRYSPLLKKSCVRQVVLDKWFPLTKGAL